MVLADVICLSKELKERQAEIFLNGKVKLQEVGYSFKSSHQFSKV